MLLDQVLAELSEKGLENAENEEHGCFKEENNHMDLISSIPQEGIALEESLDGGNSMFIEKNLNRNGANCVGSPEKELKLPLDFNQKFSSNLQNQNSERSSGFFGATASIPFQWEEKPGKPKNLTAEKTKFALRLPPIRQSRPYSHVGDPKLGKKLPKNLPGRLKTVLQGKPSEPIHEFKVPIEKKNYKQEFSSEYANSDLESIWEEEDEEEMVELCRKTYPFKEFQEMHSRRSYDPSCSESIDEHKQSISDFRNNNRRTPWKTNMVTRSTEFAPRRSFSYNPWIGSRSAEFELHISRLKNLTMVENPLPESPLSSCRSSVSDCNRPLISRSASNMDPAPALLANCLISAMEMSNAVPVEDSVFSSYNFPEKNIASEIIQKDCLDNDGSWASLVQKSLSGQIRSSQKYHQELMRVQSVQSESSLNPLKRVSSMLKRTVRDSPGSLSWGGMESGSLDNLRKTQLETSAISVKAEEEHTDDDDDDGIDNVCSPEGSPFAFVGESGSSTPFQSETSSNSCRELIPVGLHNNNSYMDKVHLGRQQSKSWKELVHFGAHPKSEISHDSIGATSGTGDYPNNVQRHFKDGLRAEALRGDMEPVKCKGCCGKHSMKKRNRAKIQPFCLVEF
eukprot:Gb_20687 [translate_table: standard]